MTRTRMNHWAGIAPFVLSGLALVLVLTVVATGWERHLPDEGTAAHLFQLMIAAQIPIIALFLWTSERTRLRSTTGKLVCQLAAIGFALAPVALFHL